MIDSRGEGGRGTLVRAPFRIAWFSRPSGGERGGDRLAVHPEAGGLRFYLADAAGHGETGAAFWRRQGTGFDEAWGTAPDLRAFVAGVNERLVRAGREHLCLAAGRIDARGSLSFAIQGYGVHVVAQGAGGRWRAAGRPFGTKLGWFDSARWGSEGVVEHAVHDLRRAIVLSDGFLGDDFADPPATLRLVDRIGDDLLARPLEEVAARALEIGEVGDDDLSLLAIEVFPSRPEPGPRLQG